MLSMQLANSQVKIRSQEDPARLRPSDVPILWADASKFQKATGWEPKIPFEQTLRDLLDYWRDRVRRGTVRLGAGLKGLSQPTLDVDRQQPPPPAIRSAGRAVHSPPPPPPWGFVPPR